jgi:hypothetical protein
MKLPVIKHLTSFIEENDQDYVLETIETLEALFLICMVPLKLIKWSKKAHQRMKH